MFDVIERINGQSATILLVEQNVRHTLRVAHMAYVLETGRIALAGSSSELLQEPRIKASYLGQA